MVVIHYGQRLQVKSRKVVSSWVLIMIYINDLIDCCEKFSDIYLFADAAKIFHHILHPGGRSFLTRLIAL